MQYSLTVKPRSTEDLNELRASGVIPAVVYGPGYASRSISIDSRNFDKLVTEAGYASLISCTIEGDKEPVMVLIQDVQYEPVKGRALHADLRTIPMNKEMTVRVALNIIGEAPAVKALGGTLVTMRDEIEVSCLPKDLVSHIDIDISGLETFENRIAVSDLVIPAGLTLNEDMELVLVTVTPPLSEDELKAMEEEGSKGVDAVEQVEKKKKEDAPAEGDAKKE
jgi:large subunit ribosomal protein L25